MKRVTNLALCGVIGAWFLYFAHGGLQADLSGDDLMNLYGYVQKPASTRLLDILRFWSTAYRPLGAALYLPLYRLFGLNPLPYRIACFLLLALNLVLLYLFCRRLSGSREIAFLSTFVASYHAWFVDLYYSAGTVYDLLCYALYLSVFLWYAQVRSQARPWRLRELLGICILFVLALDAKEMAVTLPLMLLIFEVVFKTDRLRRPLEWLRDDARLIWLTAAITAIYIAGKLAGPDSLVENPQYALTISPVRFLKTFHLYLNPLFYQEHLFRDANTARLMIGLLILAGLLRSRVLIFAWCWLLLTTLPFAFIAHYSAFFEYLPAVGWTLYIGTVLVVARRRLAGWLKGPARVWQAIVFLSLAAFLAPLHARESDKALRHFMIVEPPTREIGADLVRLQPTLRRGARVLFVGDPFPKDSYFLLYEVRLGYGDLTAEVVRTSMQPVPESEYSNYEAVFGFDGGRLVRFDKGLVGRGFCPVSHGPEAHRVS